jgi:hypothetical protein
METYAHKDGKECFNYRCLTSEGGNERISYVEFLDEHGNLIQRENVAPWYLGGDDRGDPYCLEECSYKKVTVVGWLDVDQSDRIADIRCFSEDFYPCEPEEPKEPKEPKESSKSSSSSSKKSKKSKKRSDKSSGGKESKKRSDKSSGGKKNKKHSDKSSGSKKNKKHSDKGSGSKKNKKSSDSRMSKKEGEKKHH